MNATTLLNFKSEIQSELNQILEWWMNHAVDDQHGGFHGKIDNNNKALAQAEKGLVLHARILYTFSAAFTHSRKTEYLSVADRAFAYLTENFLDRKNGGFYWSLSFDGSKHIGKKQIYGQAFAIYSLAEYYKATLNPAALSMAKETYFLLEKYSFDPAYLGYLEALTETWEPILDLRLSEKDQNEKKSMNTHLHVIEAYTNLYQIWPDPKLKMAIQVLLQNFELHIINQQSQHLNLFFTETWEVKSTVVSFGHDIEAAWLLREAAETIKDEEKIHMFNRLGETLTKGAVEGLAPNGGIWYEFEPSTQQWVYELHWWPQAEAMVGFFDSYQRSGNLEYLQAAINAWSFIKTHLKDKNNGEWFWGVKQQTSTTQHLSLMEDQDKAGFWKCPYHNGRACIELLKRLAN